MTPHRDTPAVWPGATGKLTGHRQPDVPDIFRETRPE